MGVYVHQCNAEPCITKKFGGQNMSTYAILDLENNELLTYEYSNDILTYASKEMCEAYIISRGWEDECKVIDVTKLINKYI